jgi:hypothetical protein
VEEMNSSRKKPGPIKRDKFRFVWLMATRSHLQGIDPQAGVGADTGRKVEPAPLFVLLTLLPVSRKSAQHTAGLADTSRALSGRPPCLRHARRVTSFVGGNVTDCGCHSLHGGQL